MKKNVSLKPSITDIENCLHDVLTVCDKLREETGNSFHQEAIMAILPQYEKRDNYPQLRALSLAMLRLHCPKIVISTETQDTPDLRARKEAFKILAQICLEVGDQWNPFDERRLATRLHEMDYSAALSGTFTASEDFTKFLDSLPRALTQYRRELDESFAAQAEMLAHPDIADHISAIDKLVDGAKKAAKKPHADKEKNRVNKHGKDEGKGA